MSHQTGIYYRPYESDFDIKDWEAGLKHIEDATPSFTPGTNRAYQAVTFSWIAGGIIEKASGRHFKDVVRQEIAEPLDIEDEMYVGIPEDVGDRLTTLEVWDPAEWGVPPESEMFKAFQHLNISRARHSQGLDHESGFNRSDLVLPHVLQFLDEQNE